jgi:photosystem II stability/assembly factor-like uncharacterized protein
MKTSILILFLATACNLFAQSSPEWIVYEDAPTAGRFDDIFFINDSVGWAVSSDGEIYKTTNAGESWVLKLAESTYFRSVEFFDESLGFAGTLFGNLYKTEDGGDTWVDIGNDLPVDFTGICGLSVADENTIYACGIWSSPAYIFKSVDRGETWTYTNMNDLAYSLVDIKFTDAMHGFATGQNADLSLGGIILYTDNGGATWTNKINTGHPSDYVWKIQLLDGIHAYGAIADVTGTSTTRFLKSVDNGQTWEVKLIDENYTYIEMIGFVNPDTGWTGSYEILETTDGGETWHSAYWGYNINRFYRLNNNLAFASGATLYVYTDTTYVPVDTTVDIAGYIQNHSIVNITPNPVANNMQITIQIDALTTANLAIFDMRGIKQVELHHGLLQPGKHNFSQQLNLPAGQYVLCLHSNEGLRWKNFTVIGN